MAQLTRSDLYSLEEYAQIRAEFRQRVMEHKKQRRVAIGDHAALYFEDALTMQYQIQEMLRIERIFEADGIQEELDVYNPLIPDGSNWKATFMLEYADVEARKRALARLIGIERHLYMRIGDQQRVYAVANEDLDRSAPDKTASVHFVRFELTPEMQVSAREGAVICAGIDHPDYMEEAIVRGPVRESLVGDLAILTH